MNFVKAETGQRFDAAVQYVKFPLTQPALDAFLGSDLPIALVVDHRNYKAPAPIEGAELDSLRSDFEQS